MDPIDAAAFAGLTTALTDLLPSAEPTLAPQLSINPLRVRPTGLGGYVGPHVSPDGDVVGRLLDAQALVQVKAASVDGLDAAVSSVTQALVGAGRTTLRAAGILRLELDTLGDKVPPAKAKDPAAQPVTFSVSYEFLKEPDADGGVISEIPLELDLTGDNEPRVVAAIEFDADPLAEFEVVDDPLATTGAPSSWSFVPAAFAVEQTSAISGGTTAVNANKPGTYLVLRENASRPAVADMILRAELSSSSPEGVGVVFRYQDVDNFCFFLMNQAKQYRLLAKKTGGTFSQFATPALDGTVGFDVGHVYRAKLVVRGNDVQVFLDGQLALHGQEPALAGPGRVGFMCFRNPGASFFDIELTKV